METIFFLLRIPAYIIGFVICIIAIPFDNFVSLIELVGKHALIFVFRSIGTPFVIIYSAYFDRNAWPQYQLNWQKELDDVKPDWERPFRRFPELSKWLVKGPGS
jgi:hypothetical protein